MGRDRLITMGQYGLINCVLAGPIKVVDNTSRKMDYTNNATFVIYVGRECIICLKNLDLYVKYV